MAHPDTIPDPHPSISAAELRRRLLSSTPPPASAQRATLDLGTLAAPPLPQSGSQRNSGIIRLTMPGVNGPVAASALPPVQEAAPAHGPGPLPPPGYRPRLGGDSMLGTPAVPEPHAPRSVQIPPASAGSTNSANPTPEDYKRARQEARELRKLLEDMKTVMQEASENEQKASLREQELLGQLQLKQRQLDELTSQMQTIEDQVASGALAPAPAVPKTRSELDEWADDLERENSKLTQERRKLEDERQQLREDEESLETQMRQMEVSMARERALMARQETELKRLSAEIQHELELMQRGDAALRDQLSKFQRRAADVLQKPSGAPAGGRR